MNYVYLLKAINSDWIYIGYTTNLKKRLAAHMAKQNITSSRLGPMRLFYYEAYVSMQDAKEREKQLKQYGAALGHLKRRTRRSLESIGVAPMFSESQKVRGSIPSRIRTAVMRGNLRGKGDVGLGDLVRKLKDLFSTQMVANCTQMVADVLSIYLRKFAFDLREAALEKGSSPFSKTERNMC